MRIIIALLAASPLAAQPSNIDPAHKHARCDSLGWMNWRDADGGAQGVHAGPAHLTGYIWSGAGWITFGLDGKYVFPASGDVIDAATKKTVGYLNDEFGRPVYSEKIVEVEFSPEGKMIRATDQFGVGMVRTSTN